MKGRKKREAGGVNEAEADLKSKTPDRSSPNNVAKEADEMKKGGRAKRKHGGKMEHKVEGEKMKMHAGRKPRKNGGRTGSDTSPFSSARKGTEPSGHKSDMMD
jgi:hypothetical protein